MNDVTGHFEVLVNGNLETYNRIGDIPLICLLYTSPSHEPREGGVLPGGG